uniref:Uncharacterized protein 4F11.8 n=1 Tax=Anopheles gambiae TaxID=7165 RepID=Q8T5K8_ANOGA|nr:hypothetical protein [Anopheles gambiae]
MSRELLKREEGIIFTVSNTPLLYARSMKRLVIEIPIKSSACGTSSSSSTGGDSLNRWSQTQMAAQASSRYLTRYYHKRLVVW